MKLLIVALAATVFATALPADESIEQKRAVRQAVDIARELRQSDNIYDQFAAAGTLAEIGDKESLQFLTDNLAHSDWVVMRSAIDTLLNVQHPSALNVIYRYAAITEDKMFMKFLSESLASRPREDMADFLLESLDVDDLWVRKHALQALALTPLEDKEARMRAIAEDFGQDTTSRAYAYYALMDTAARDESAQKLVDIAYKWNAEAQEAAAVGLGQMDTEATREALKSLRKASTYKVQIAALASEAGFGNEESIDHLVSIIGHGKGLDPSVAAASLRRLSPEVVKQITLELMQCCELNSDVATRLVESWAAIDSDPELVYNWGLTNKNPDIRMQSVWLVGARNDLQQLARVLPFLDDADSGIRSMAAWTVVRLLGDHYEPGTEI